MGVNGERVEGRGEEMGRQWGVVGKKWERVEGSGEGEESGRE